MSKKVTDKIKYGNPEDEFLPIIECLCGHKFDWWEHTISIYRDDPTPCPACGARLYFEADIYIYQVEDK